MAITILNPSSNEALKTWGRVFHAAGEIAPRIHPRELRPMAFLAIQHNVSASILSHWSWLAIRLSFKFRQLCLIPSVTSMPFSITRMKASETCSLALKQSVIMLILRLLLDGFFIIIIKKIQFASDPMTSVGRLIIAELNNKS